MRNLRTVLIFLLPILSVAAWGETIRIAPAPLLGSAPLIFAEEWGLFAEEGVEISIVPLASQRDRLMAFHAGQVDALIGDVASAVLLAALTDPLVVATAYLPKPTERQFALLVNGRYVQEESLEELLPLLGKRNFLRIALPLQSDIEFALDTVLKGLSEEPNPRLYFGQDDLFLAASMVVYGMVAAAVLPEPYASFSLEFAKAEGLNLRELPDFKDVPPLPHLIIFQRSFVEKHPDAVRRFLAAFSAAAERMNEESKEGLLSLGAPEVLKLFYRGTDPEEVLTNPSVKAAIQAIKVPEFPPLGILDSELYRAVHDWALEKRYIKSAPPYEDVVTNEFAG